MHAIAQQLNDVRKHLTGSYLEREDAITVMILALLTGQHSFLLGPPGTAKSELVRALVNTIKGARYFEAALSKTRPTEAVFGPMDLKLFREDSVYRLQREHYASDVEFLFLDEVGKMSPVLGHDLLALLNERIIHEVRDGKSVHDAPLSTAFTASNEMITDESDDAAALWDRLLLRCVVGYLENSDNFKTLLTSTIAPCDIEINWTELQDVIQNIVPRIPIHPAALEALVGLRKEFQRESLSPSDRRWRASMAVLQAAAFLDGRTSVEEDDIALLRFTLWDTLEQIEKVERLTLAAANPFVEPLLEIREMIKEVDAKITERDGVDANGNDQKDARNAYGKEAVQKLADCRNRLDTLLIESAGRRIPTFKFVSDLHKRTLYRAFQICLEQSEENATEMIKQGNRLGSGDGGQS